MKEYILFFEVDNYGEDNYGERYEDFDTTEELMMRVKELALDSRITFDEVVKVEYCSRLVAKERIVEWEIEE